jgi:hypothetical protein
MLSYYVLEIEIFKLSLKNNGINRLLSQLKMQYFTVPHIVTLESADFWKVC